MKIKKALLSLLFVLFFSFLNTLLSQAQSRYESIGSSSAATTVNVQLRQAQKAKVNFKIPFKSKTKVVAQNGYYNLDACIDSETTPSVEVFINGKSQKSRGLKVVSSQEVGEGQFCPYNFQHSFSLQEGNNTIYLMVKNLAGTITTQTYHVHYTYIAPEKRIALVIGNEKYVKGSELLNPVNDATVVADSLRGLGFDVQLHTDLTQRELKKAIDEFAKAQVKYNVALFYYAGHGVQVRSGRYNANFLMPIDADPKTEQEAEYDCVALGRVLSAMEASDNKANIVILDACRDNPFERRWASRSMGGGHGLANINAPLNYFIAYSTAVGKTAKDGNGKTTHSPFTTELLQHLNRSELSIEQLFKTITKKVSDKTRKEQVPWSATSLTEPFYFVMPK